jgi:hypothetical protein
MKLRKIYSHDAPTNNTAERRVGRRPYTDATHYRRLFADRAALATRQPCRGPHRVTLHNRASVAQRRCRCAPASNQSRHQVAFHVDQRHLVCRVYDSPSTSPHSPQCGRTGQRKTHVNPNQLCTELNAAVILAFPPHRDRSLRCLDHPGAFSAPQISNPVRHSEYLGQRVGELSASTAGSRCRFR